MLGPSIGDWRGLATCDVPGVPTAGGVGRTTVKLARVEVEVEV